MDRTRARGGALALGRRSSLPVISGFCTLYIESVRGVPLITVLFMTQLLVPLVDAGLAETPNDAAGWVMLGRSNFVLQRFDAAVAAYARATTLITDDADLFADYADALEVWDGAAWVASGKVNGTVLNQFSMSEYGGVFRIATTTADSSRTSSPRK